MLRRHAVSWISFPTSPTSFRCTSSRTSLIMRATDPFQNIAKDVQRNAEIALFTYAHELTASKRAKPTDDVFWPTVNSMTSSLTCSSWP